MRVVVVTGGVAPQFEHVSTILSECDRVYAADSGFDWCQSNDVYVNVLVGDMDSIKTENTQAVDRVYRFPRAKDYTDTELAIHRARTDGATHITLIGGGGGRLDHVIALLYLFSRPTAPQTWITDSDYVEYVTSVWNVELPVNTRISIFPVGQPCAKLSSNGLHWNLDGLNWNMGDIGISNYNDSRAVNITVHSGSIIVVRSLHSAIG